MSASLQFQNVQRTHGECHAHKSLPVWVVHYPSTNVRGAHFQAYIAKGFGHGGRHPCMGGVDNRRVGTEHGFVALDDACKAAIAKAQGGAL